MKQRLKKKISRRLHLVVMAAGVNLRLCSTWSTCSRRRQEPHSLIIIGAKARFVRAFFVLFDPTLCAGRCLCVLSLASSLQERLANSFQVYSCCNAINSFICFLSFLEGNPHLACLRLSGTLSGEVSPSILHDLFGRNGEVWLSPFKCRLIQTQIVARSQMDNT